MKYKKGDKVILKLDTKYRTFGIRADSHNNVCIINYCYTPSSYEIRDGEHYWSVYEEMLELAPLVGEQLLFEFMKE